MWVNLEPTHPLSMETFGFFAGSRPCLELFLCGRMLGCIFDSATYNSQRSLQRVQIVNEVAGSGSRYSIATMKIKQNGQLVCLIP
jgi:hypothetical protein